MLITNKNITMAKTFILFILFIVVLEVSGIINVPWTEILFLLCVSIVAVFVGSFIVFFIILLLLFISEILLRIFSK
jgi:hypothetical protein